jgi:MFS family permease
MSARLTGAALRDFWVLTFAQALLFCGFFAFFQFPVFIQHVGGQEREIGIIMGAGAFASTLLIPWIAEFVNRGDRKRLMLGGMGLLAAATLACLGLTAPDGWMALLSVLRGLGFAVYVNASGAYVTGILPAEERSRWIGINFGFNQIAVAIGPAVAEWVILQLGYVAFFLESTGFVLAGMALIARITRRVPEGGRRPFRLGQIGREFFRDLGRPDNRYLYLTLLMMACGLGAVFNFTATFLRDLGLSSGLFFLIYALINAATRIGGGGVSDKYGRSAVILPTLGVFALGLLLYGTTEGLPMLIAAALAIGLGFGMSNPAMLAQLLDRSPSSTHGRVVGSFHFAYQLGALCSTPLFGVIAQSQGYRPMWRVAGAFAVAAAAVYALGMWRGGRGTAPARAEARA